MMDNVVQLTPERTRIIERLGDLTMAQSSVPMSTLVRLTGVDESDLHRLFKSSKIDLWKIMTLYACRVAGMRQMKRRDDKALAVELQKSFMNIIEIFTEELGTEEEVVSFRTLLNSVDDLLEEDYPEIIQALVGVRLDLAYVEEYLRAILIYGFMRDPAVGCLIQEFFTYALGQESAASLVARLGEYRG